MPFLTEVERLSLIDNTINHNQAPVPGLLIEKTGPQGRERIGARLPLVAVMGNSPVFALRAATLAARMRAGKRSPELAAGIDIAAAETPPVFVRERKVKNSRFSARDSGLDRSVQELAEQL